eukprot:scaffold76832_cov58-Phaeocystis_antarctica.AAC.6
MSLDLVVGDDEESISSNVHCRSHTLTSHYTAAATSTRAPLLLGRVVWPERGRLEGRRRRAGNPNPNLNPNPSPNPDPRRAGTSAAYGVQPTPPT